MIALWLVVSLCILQVTAVHGASKCPLCNSLEEVPRRLDYILETNPSKTCADAWLQLGSLNKSSGQCSSLQSRYREKCCGSAEPPAIYTPPAPSPKETGTEPFCRICGNDRYPGKPNARVVARYVGDYSCGQLYDRGRNGLIPGFMCNPLKHFAYDVCECAGSEPAPTKPSPPLPTRNPTRQPTRRPTSKPNPQPTSRPNPQPTRQPTRPPTRNPTPRPSARPTRGPTRNPTPRPTSRPTRRPTRPPTREPTPEPTPYPTAVPTTPGPTREPTPGPSRFPTPRPTRGPTPQPTRFPVAPTFEASELSAPTMAMDERRLPPLVGLKQDMKFARRAQGGANNIVRGRGNFQVIPNEVPV